MCCVTSPAGPGVCSRVPSDSREIRDPLLASAKSLFDLVYSYLGGIRRPHRRGVTTWGILVRQVRDVMVIAVSLVGRSAVTVSAL